MKIYIMVPYFNIDGIELSIHNSGFGFTTADIAENLVRFGDEVYALLYSGKHPAMEVNGIKLTKMNFGRYASQIFSHPLKMFSSIWKRNEYSLCDDKRMKKALHRKAIACLVENELKKVKPDIVSLHDIQETEYITARICNKLKIPFTITLHGLEVVQNGQTFVPECDIKVIAALYEMGGKFSAVSSGVKMQFKNLFPDKEIACIPNSMAKIFETAIFDEIEYKNTRAELGFTNNDNVFFTAGSLRERKNQIQMLRIMEALKNRNIGHIKYVLAGPDDLNGKLQNFAKEAGIEKNVIFLGCLEKRELIRYYNACDFVIMTSISEAFGLSLIEGMALGKPAITFRDFSAAEDIYDEKAVELIESRSDEELLNTILKVTEKKWDVKNIRKHAESFFPLKMAERYHNFFVESLMFIAEDKNAHSKKL